MEYQINLDPTVWIFDERKIPLKERFPGIDDWGMHLAFEHAKPKKEATHVIIVQANGQQTQITLEQAKQAILRFIRRENHCPDRPLLYFTSAMEVMYKTPWDHLLNSR